MTKQEQAEIILDSLDLFAPTNINWSMKDLWVKAIVNGLNNVERKEVQP